MSAIFIVKILSSFIDHEIVHSGLDVCNTVTCGNCPVMHFNISLKLAWHVTHVKLLHWQENAAKFSGYLPPLSGKN